MKVESIGFPDRFVGALKRKRGVKNSVSVSPKQLRNLSCCQIWSFGGKDKNFNLGHFLIYLLHQNKYFYISLSQVEMLNRRYMILGFESKTWAGDRKKKKKGTISA